MVSILHLSNLRFLHSALDYTMQEALLREARAKVHDKPVGEKLLIITGDLHDYPSQTNYTETLNFLRRLIDTMGIDPKNDVFLVPGNHDVGNDFVLDQILKGEDPRWKMHNKAALAMLKHGEMDFIPDRLPAFRPYSNFARELGVYDSSEGLDYPATAHIRNWRGKLNILHLNTALVADGIKKNNQMTDIDSATNPAIWSELYNESIPTIALGHDSFFDLIVEQQRELATLFSLKNVSAYLCGDTHQLEIDNNQKLIQLQSGFNGSQAFIPNILSVRATDVLEDSFNVIGFCWHEWEERNDTVTFRYSTWNHATMSFNSQSKLQGVYAMRKKTPSVLAASTKHSSTSEGSESETYEYHSLLNYLHEVLERTRKMHPSYKQMQCDEIDKRLFPNAQGHLLMPFGRQEETGITAPLGELIRKTWTEDIRRNIVIVGKAGAGKSTSLLSISIENSSSVPIIFVPLHRLINSNDEIVRITEYCMQNYTPYSSYLLQLASKPWRKGPNLLVVLDGFNEIPSQLKWPLLQSVNVWYSLNPGSQIIISSRPIEGIDLRKDVAGNPVAIELCPLSTDVVNDYLKEVGKTVPKDQKILELISTPLYLSLYVKSNLMTASDYLGYPLSFRPIRGEGTMTWNYLQRELFRLDSEDWIIRCATACEFILPHIAYEMIQSNLLDIGIDKAKEMIDTAIPHLASGNLPKHLTSIYREYESRHYKKPSISADNLYDTVLQETGLLVPIQNRRKTRYSFIHEGIMYCLAAIHMVNVAEVMQASEYPVEWRKGQSKTVITYVAELIDSDTCGNLWNALKKHTPLDRNAVRLYLDIEKLRSDGKELDFSGMDLSEVCLVPYLRPTDKPMELFTESRLSVGTHLALQTLWDVECSSGRPIRGISPVYKNLVATACKKTINLWDSISDRIVNTLNGHRGDVLCLSHVSADMIASGSIDGTVRIWDTKSGVPLSVLNHSSAVNCIVAAGPSTIVTGSEDGVLAVWDAITGQCLTRMTGHTAAITCISALQNGLIVSGSADEVICIWDVVVPAREKPLRILKGHIGRVCCIAVLPNGNIVSGSTDKTVRIWNANTGEMINVLCGHTLPVNCVTVTPDSRIISGSQDGTIRVWNASDGSLIAEKNEHGCAVTAVTVAENGLLYSGSEDGIVRVWDNKLNPIKKYYHSEVDVTGMHLDEADPTDEVGRMLWQNGAKTKKQYTFS